MEHIKINVATCNFIVEPASKFNKHDLKEQGKLGSKSNFPEDRLRYLTQFHNFTHFKLNISSLVLNGKGHPQILFSNLST